MTREEKKAIDGNKYYPEDVNGYYAFLHGAEWSDKHPKNVWHDLSEEPRKYEYILFEYISTKNELKYFTQYVTPYDGNLLKEFEKFGKCRWAYISDLLPKGGD